MSSNAKNKSSQCIQNSATFVGVRAQIMNAVDCHSDHLFVNNKNVENLLDELQKKVEVLTEMVESLPKQLNDMVDVDSSKKINGSVLVWDQEKQKWVTKELEEESDT